MTCWARESHVCLALFAAVIFSTSFSVVVGAPSEEASRRLDKDTGGGGGAGQQDGTQYDTGVRIDDTGGGTGDTGGGTDDAGKDASYANQVIITVFGEVGASHSQQGAPLECSLMDCPRDARAVGQWMLSIILRSMTKTQTGDEDLLGSKPPEVSIGVVPPFGLDPFAPKGGKGDQRSAFRRTFFRFKFGSLTESVAKVMANNLCEDYMRDEEELLKGIIIVLIKENMRPHEAMNVVAHMGLSLRSIVPLRSSVENPTGTPLIGAGCNWDVQAQSGTDQGIFYHPPCPANSHSTDDESDCECNFAYEGTIQYTQLESGLYAYRGQCLPVKDFCPSDYTMRKENGDPALGILQEEAYAECPPGYESTGLATCIARGDVGAWSPSKLCRFVPPEEPPPVLCAAPDRTDLLLSDCGGCQAELPPIKATTCTCRARCRDNYKQLDAASKRYWLVTDFSDAKPIACLNVPYHCPPEEALSWLPAAREGARCVMKETLEVLGGKDLCCPEAWGASRPSDLRPDDCRSLRDEAACFGGAQAGGEHEGAPCCWHRAARDSEEPADACGPKGDPAVARGAYGCAVPRHLPEARWEDEFPVCERMCENNFKAFEPSVVSRGCDACIPGEDPDCGCTVECSPGTVFFGGGAVSKRACDAESRDFGPVPLCKEPPVSVRVCLAPSADGLALGGHCGECEVGKPCDCTVRCKETHKHLAGEGEEGAKSCELADAPLDATDCTQISDQWDCIHSKHDRVDGAGSEVPCCWRGDFFADGQTRCAPRGSELIGVAHPPSACADMKATQWAPRPPTCAPVCADPFALLPSVATNGRCGRCLPGEKCGCEVRCAAGMERYGGGPVGEARVCDGGAGGFGPPPVCGAPDPPPTCDGAELERADLVTSGCHDCSPGKPCQCSAQCPMGFVDVEGPQAGPRCEEEAALEKAQCRELSELAPCLASAQEGSGAPCCWLGPGHDGAPSCLPRGSELMRGVPVACAHPAVRWANIPNCKQKCRNSMRGALNVEFRPSLEACDGCVAGEPCECQPACAPGTLYYGGGPLQPRSCTEAELDLGEAPLCSSPEETLQPCAPPDGSKFALGGDCSGCSPGENGPGEKCGCTVRCLERYRPRQGSEGARTCSKADADLTPANCAELGDQASCLRSRQSGGPPSGKPCCYHKPGGEGDEVCAPMESGHIDRPVVACAQQFASRWEPALPDCQPVCEDIFAGVPGVEASGCSGCIAGDEACPCTVSCAHGMDHYGGPQPGRRACPASGRFEAPPVCGPKEEAPECRWSDVGAGLVGEGEGCQACRAGEGGEGAGCSCRVSCAEDFVDSGTGGAEGRKSCHVRVRPSGSAKCADIEDKPTCVKSLEGEKPCVWQRAPSSHGRSGVCLAKGSPQVTSVPDADSYARRMFAEWDPMPTCLPRCSHDFASRLSPNVQAVGCDRCHVGQRQQADGGESGPDVCPCRVQCSEGTERYGGGSEGPRACSEAHPRFEPPPLCLPPPSARCLVPPGRHFDVRGCKDCQAGSRAGGEGCSDCSIACSEGYLQTGGGGAEVACEEVDASDGLQAATCSSISKSGQCLKSREEVGPGQFQPCCYRALTFSAAGAGRAAPLVCLPKASPLIPWDQPPDECAPLAEGAWRGLPVCADTCRNTFRGLEGIVEEGCDACAASNGEQCPCRVSCRPPTQALAGPDPSGAPYPPEGPKRCLLRDGQLAFEPPPVCHVPCQPPGTDGGTLDVSQCTPEGRPDGEECFPGSDCPCIVSCAADFRPVGGGTNGGRFHCNEAGAYAGLPVCRPLCRKPEDQFGQLDTSACSLCTAGSPDCRCELRCRGQHVGGGPEGAYTCLFQPGAEGSLARAFWALADEAERGRLGERGRQVPSCLSPIFVTVVSALTKKGQAGVLIEVFSSTDTLSSQTTGASGQIQLGMISNEEVLVVASLEGFSTIQRRFQRSRFCVDPTANCGMQLSMSPVLKSGTLNPDGCYFTAGAQKAEWEMRAVLEWTNDPKDLDLWARSLDCYLSTAERYGCERKKRGCERYRFAEPSTKASEEQSCDVRRCLSLDSQTQLYPDGVPRCPPAKTAANQFPKWVFWKTRYAGTMHRRLEGKGSRSSAVPIKASAIRIVTLAGFVTQAVRGLCGGRPCSLLNGDYVERPGSRYRVGDRETYWKGDDLFIFYCGSDATWRIAASGTFQQALEGTCNAYASSLPNRDVLDPAKIPFPQLWHSGAKAFQTHESAAVSRLHLPDGTKDLDWNPDHYMFLNVDHRSGYGPETVTFHNVPPGTYQIAVNTYSRNDVNNNIRDGRPTVSVYVGGDSRAMFECEISPECNNASRVWNVLNVQIFEGGEELVDGRPTGKNRYYLRVHDSAETLQRLREVDLPTGENPAEEEAKYEAPKKSQYFVVSPSDRYNDQQLKYVCHGRCTPAPGYEQCMERPP